MVHPALAQQIWIDQNATDQPRKHKGERMSHKLTDETIAALNNPDRPRVAYIVWNAARTEGYVTFDKQVAYEARKGAASNCFDSEGTQMKLAQAFCDVHSDEGYAPTETVVLISQGETMWI